MNALLKPLVESVFSPAAFDFWAGHINPAWSWQRPLARIIGREISARDCVTLTLKPNRHVAPFQAGQHLNISMEINGMRVTRSYSPSRVPGRAGEFSITVKRMAGGKASAWLYEQAHIGDALEIGPAFGDMTLTATQGDRLFLAAGSGITPFISLARDWAAQGAQGKITLLYWARSGADLCGSPEFNALAHAHPNFRVQYLLTQEAGAGRINREQLSALVPELDQRQVYACGPAGFVEEARLLSQRALGFHGEAFSLPQAAISSDQRVNVHLSRSQRTLSVPVGQPLLLALEEQGLNPASGCRMGICNTCVCTQQAGTTAHVLTGAEQAEAGSSVRLCISSARSELTLDL